MPNYKCWCCGNEFKSAEKIQKRAFCKSCAPVVPLERVLFQKEYAEMRRKAMLDTAIEKLEKAGALMCSYFEIATNLKKEFDSGELVFRSSDEIVAALVLRKFNIEFEVNKKFKSYTIDFFIPDKHVVLEIDGDRHIMSTIEDGRRDINLRRALGPEWEVIRIATNYMEKNPERLLLAIEAMYKEKKRLRKENNGIIPEFYSQREKEVYESLTEWRTVTRRTQKRRY